MQPPQCMHRKQSRRADGGLLALLTALAVINQGFTSSSYVAIELPKPIAQSRLSDSGCAA